MLDCEFEGEAGRAAFRTRTRGRGARSELAGFVLDEDGILIVCVKWPHGNDYGKASEVCVQIGSLPPPDGTARCENSPSMNPLYSPCFSVQVHLLPLSARGKSSSLRAGVSARIGRKRTREKWFYVVDLSGHQAHVLNTSNTDRGRCATSLRRLHSIPCVMQILYGKSLQVRLSRRTAQSLDMELPKSESFRS